LKLQPITYNVAAEL